MGPWRGSLGESIVLADQRVRVFKSSGLVDRTSDHPYVHNITLYRCTGILSHYIPFSSQSWLACHRKTCTLSTFPEELHLYGIPWRGPPGPWTFSDDRTAWGIPHTEPLSFKNWEAYILGVRSTLVTRFNCTQQLRNTGWADLLNSTNDFCWLDLPRWSFRHHLGLIAL